MAIPPNYGVDLLTDNIGKDSNMQETYGSVIQTRDGDPVECHICGINQSINRCPDRDNIYTQGNREE